MWRRVVEAWEGISDVDSKQRDPSSVHDFQRMKELVLRRDSSVMLIDVREPNEFNDYSIPGSVNVPFMSHPQGFALDENEFKATFGFNKPSKDKKLIFYCASGKRGASAEEFAKKQGYTNVALYPGSINDWLSKGGSDISL